MEMSITLRKRFLEKLAQATPTGLPTDQQTTSTTISGSPPAFSATQLYPGIIAAFQAKNAVFINNLANLINNALFYDSGGKVNLLWARNVNFVFETDVPSDSLRFLMLFSKLIFNNLFTNGGTPYLKQLSADEIKYKINLLNNSQPLNSLPVTAAGSQLYIKIGGNLKELVKSILLQIK